jgi:hypothetical protein
MMPQSVLYSRELPGGGYVLIEAVPQTATAFRARVAVERRTDPLRRAGHEPPVVADLAGESRADIYGELYRIASDNVAVSAALQRWQARHRK